MENKCYVCKCESNEVTFIVPGTIFGFLEGKPFICDKCMARSFGADVPWSDSVETKLKEKTI